MTTHRILGIDVSKDWLDACLLPSEETWHTAMEPAVLESWIASLPLPLDFQDSRSLTLLP